MLNITIAIIVMLMQLLSLGIAIYSISQKEYSPYLILTEVGFDFAIVGLLFAQLLIQSTLLRVINLCLWTVIIVLDFIKARDYKWDEGGDKYAF